MNGAVTRRLAFAPQRILGAVLVCAAGMITSHSVYAQSEQPLATVESAQDEDSRLIEGLLQRRLFKLARRFAAERIVAPELSPQQQAELAAELVRTYALEASHAPPERREALWLAATKVPVTFEQQFPENRFALLPRVQAAIALLAQGKLARQEGEILADEQLTLKARATLRGTTERLEALQEETDQRLRDSHRSDTLRKGPDLNSAQLLSLSRRITLLRAEATENHALSHPADSDDQRSLLLQALKLVEPLVTLPPESPLLWPSLLLEIRSARRLGRNDTVRQRLQALAEREPPLEIQLEAQAEEVRLLLATDQLDDALEIVNKRRSIGGREGAEMDFASFETFVALWKRAERDKNEPQVDVWQSQASAVVNDLEQLYGSYWARRAELLLTQQALSGTSQNIDLLQRTAEGYVRKREWPEALANYDRAIQAATAASETARTYQLRLAAAAVAVRANQYREASRRFEGAANLHPAEKDAGQRHLMAAYYESLAAREEPSPSLDRYATLLQENLQLWPRDESAEQAAMWLAQLRFASRRWSDATKAYMRVSPESTHFSLAVDGARQAALQWFQEDKQRGELVSHDVEKVIEYFERIITQGSDNAAGWTSTMRLATETASQLWLNYVDNGYAGAQAVLEIALRSDPDAPTGWRNRLESLLVVAYAGQGDLAAAQQTLDRVGGDSAERLFELLLGLNQVANSATPQIKQEMAKLELLVIENLKPMREQLEEIARLEIDIREAEALAITGQQEEAKRLYQALAKAHPNNLQIQLGLGHLLASSEARADWEAGLAQWRMIQGRSRPQSPNWYEAKYQIAHCHIRLGNHQEAVQMLRYLGTLDPEMGGEEMKGRFQRLLRLAQSGA